MMLVTQQEAFYIREHSTYVRISMCNKKKSKSRKRYYADECLETDRLIEEYRAGLIKN